MPEKHRDRRVGWTDVWHLRRGGLQPVRQPGQRAALRRRPQHAGAARDRGRRRRRPAADDGRVRAAAGPGPARCATTSSRWRSSSRRASRSRSTATCCAGRSGRCGSASTTARGSCIHTRRLRGRRPRAAGRAPALVRRDGRPVPRPDATTTRRRTAFDIGEWGLGFMTTSLELGCDCLGEIAYLDAVRARLPGRAAARSATRSASTRRTTRSSGSTSTRGAGAEVRRARRLVVSFHVTVANYEYLVYWRFYQDGSIECEVRATGIMVTTHFPRASSRRYGTLVDERTYAPFHQHFLVARLDMDVDGEDNTVHMTESEALPTGAGQPARARRWCSAACRCAPSRRASRTTTGTPSAPGRSSTRARRQRARHAGRLQARARRAASRRMLDPRLAGLPARRR